MTVRLHLICALAWMAFAGCGGPSPAEAAFEEKRGSGDFRIVASTSVGGDRIDFWKDVGVDDPSFGPFLISARAPSGRLLDFCSGEFVSSARPFFQSSRYVVLVAAERLGGKRLVFHAYDSRSKNFSMHSVDGVAPDVHDNILVLGDHVFFASCKTTTPVGRLDLASGRVSVFGPPAPQSASFRVSGSTVFAVSNDNRSYRIEERRLVESDLVAAADPAPSPSFDEIRIR